MVRYYMLLCSLNILSMLGVNNNKYLSGKKDSKAVEAIIKANSEADFDGREDVYSSNREALQYQIRLVCVNDETIKFVLVRNSLKAVQKMCRGFNSHWKHIARHFSWLASCDSLEGTVEENLLEQLGFLEQYLVHVDQSIEFKEKLVEIEEAMHTEFDGNRTYKDVQILVRIVFVFL